MAAFLSPGPTQYRVFKLYIPIKIRKIDPDRPHDGQAKSFGAAARPPIILLWGKPVNHLRALVLLSLLLAMERACAATVNIDLGEGVHQIDAEIASHVRKVAAANGAGKNGNVYIESLVRGDIDGNGSQDAFVSYSVEGIGGGNFSLLQQTLFLRMRGRLIPVRDWDNGSFGTATGSSFVPKAMVRGKVLGRMLQYAPGDGTCCPSIDRPASLVFKNNRLYGQIER